MIIVKQPLIWRLTSAASYFSLFIWVLLWNALISPPRPAALVLLVLLTPLLFVLRGVLHSNRRTYIWISLMTPFYFALGISHAYVKSTTQTYGIGLLIFSLLLFASAIGMVRSSRNSERTN